MLRLAIVVLVFAASTACLGQRKGEGRKLLSPEQLAKLLPKRIDGFAIDGASIAKTMSIGNLTYSICQRNFVRGKKSVRLLLFDYIDAGIMYEQSMRKWSEMKPLESDSIYFHRNDQDSLRRFDSFRKSNQQSQIVMGIHNRFFFSATATNVSFDDLQTIVSAINVQQFPR